MRVIRDVPEGFDYAVLTAALVRLMGRDTVDITDEFVKDTNASRMIIYYDEKAMVWHIEVRPFADVVDGEVVQEHDPLELQERRSITDGR